MIPIETKPCLRVSDTTLSDPQSCGSRHGWTTLWKNVESDRADATGVGKLHPLPPNNTFPVVKGKKWEVGGVLWVRKINKERHLYEFSCYSVKS